MSFYENCRHLQKQNPRLPMPVHEWKDAFPPKVGRLYRHDGGLFIITEQSIALVFHDDQVQAMVREGLIRQDSLKASTIN